MPSLPWARMDTNMPTHDKILALLSDPSPKKYQAAMMYPFGILWSTGAGTDGHIPIYAIRVIHGTPFCARLLVKYRLWTEATVGWQIVNFDERQQLSGETYTIRKSQIIGGKKGACVKHHGPDCGCWRKSL